MDVNVSGSVNAHVVSEMIREREHKASRIGLEVSLRILLGSSLSPEVSLSSHEAPFFRVGTKRQCGDSHFVRPRGHCYHFLFVGFRTVEG